MQRFAHSLAVCNLVELRSGGSMSLRAIKQHVSPTVTLRLQIQVLGAFFEDADIQVKPTPTARWAVNPLRHSLKM
jgi:hypothetical protein